MSRTSQPGPLAALRLGALAAAALALTGTAGAQQFDHIPGTLGPLKNWTEGVEAADVDNDGDLDIFFADGGGFSSPGTQYQNRLLLNTSETTPGTVSDVSVARLGVNLSHSKGVFTGDVDDDGLIDACFANAFNTDPPHLYINGEGGQDGFFKMDSSARGLTESISSSSGAFGDSDNDGDLDLVLCDSGNSYLGGAGGKLRFYENDGAGNYSEKTGSGWSIFANKTAHRNVHFTDVDNDWDLDVVGFTKGPSHFLMLNDGTGNYNQSDLIPNTSGGNVYEAEAGDLDNDDDIDFFYISLSSFLEGHQRNNLIESGNLGWVSGGTVAGTGVDDNEVSLFDYDLDGDKDAFVARLGGRERVERNNYVGSGTLNFTNLTAPIENVNDSTLALTHFDLDGDGAYDMITAQGESASAGWDNKFYKNTGAADNRAPRITAVESLSNPSVSGPWVFRANATDEVLDDGKDWMTGEVDWVVSDPNVVNVSMSGFSFVPAVINVTVGTTVVWDNPTGNTHDVLSTTPGYSFYSGDMFQNDTFSYTFVRPGTYDYVCTYHAGFGMTGQVIVTGSPNNAEGKLVGNSQRRFTMFDPSPASGSQLVYEVRFTDDAGNFTVTDSTVVTLPQSCGFTEYGAGASPANILSLSGNGSTTIGSSVNIVTTGVTTSPTFVTLSFGQSSFPLLGGVALIDPFTIVTTLTIPSVGSTATLPFPLPNDPVLKGLALYFQSAAVDVGLPGLVALSNGLELVICN